MNIKNLEVSAKKCENLNFSKNPFFDKNFSKNGKITFFVKIAFFSKIYHIFTKTQKILFSLKTH